MLVAVDTPWQGDFWWQEARGEVKRSGAGLESGHSK